MTAESWEIELRDDLIATLPAAVVLDLQRDIDAYADRWEHHWDRAAIVVYGAGPKPYALASIENAGSR